MSISICGCLFVYNEEHILDDSLSHYLGQGIDLVVFDNDSTDSSREIVEKHKALAEHEGRILEIVTVKTSGYEWRKILKVAEDYIKEHLMHYDWMMLIDADSFYFSPVVGLSLKEFIALSKNDGSNVIDGQLIEFYPTERDDLSISSPVERLRYCKVLNPDPQHKIFIPHPSMDFHLSAGHSLARPDRKIASIRFLYCHYKWVSVEHGLKKVFKERLPRYVEQREHMWWRHPQYSGLLPSESELLKDSSDLTLYDEKKHQLSPIQFKFLLKISPLIRTASAFKQRINRRLNKKVISPLQYYYRLLRFDFRTGLKKTLEDYTSSDKNKRSNKPKGGEKFKIITDEEILAQEISVWRYPKRFTWEITSETEPLKALEASLTNIPDIYDPFAISIKDLRGLASNQTQLHEILVELQSKFPHSSINLEVDLAHELDALMRSRPSIPITLSLHISNVVLGKEPGTESRLHTILGLSENFPVEFYISPKEEHLSTYDTLSSLNSLTQKLATRNLKFYVSPLHILPALSRDPSYGRELTTRYSRLTATVENALSQSNANVSIDAPRIGLYKKHLRLHPWSFVSFNSNGRVLPWEGAEQVLQKRLGQNIISEISAKSTSLTFGTT